MAFIGDCQCQFTAGGYSIHRVWLQDSSKLVAVLTDHSHLHIDLFGNTELLVRIASPNARASINQYGNSKCTVEGYSDKATVTIHNQATY